MADWVQKLGVKVYADTRDADRDITQFRGHVKGAADDMSTAGRRAGDLDQIGTHANRVRDSGMGVSLAWAGAALAFGHMFQAADESRRVSAQTTAVLNSMGGAAG